MYKGQSRSNPALPICLFFIGLIYFIPITAIIMATILHYKGAPAKAKEKKCNRKQRNMMKF